MTSKHVPRPVLSDRRTVLGGMAAMAWALGPDAVQAAPVRHPHNYGRFAYVGCRTSRERQARGEGIEVFRLDPLTGAWSHVQRMGGLVNPSFLCLDADQRFLYAVHGDQSQVSAFAIAPQTGMLTLLNQQSTQGLNPVHLTTDPSNRLLIIANYKTGAIAVLPRRTHGGLDPVQQLETLPGAPGPIRDEQSSSHPHEVMWDRAQRHLIVPDKGLDRIFTFTLDEALGQLRPGRVPFVQLRPGTGPRHITFHPNLPFAYASHELASGVGTYRFDQNTGALSPVQFLPSIPDDYVRANTAAGIAITPDGKFTFVSNRGHDSIGCFRVKGDGRLSPVGWTSSGGNGPRFITLDPSGSLLYVANELSDTILAFHIDPASGHLRPKGKETHSGSPVCIAFLR